MGYVVTGLGTAFSGFTMHRNPSSSFERPALRPAALSLLGVAITYLTTGVGFLQRFLDTVSLTPGQWLVCFGLAIVFPVVVELDKAWQRHRRLGRDRLKHQGEVTVGAAISPKQ